VTTTAATAVITGGTRGFGLAMARAFLAEGYQVAFCGRSEAGVREALGRLAEHGPRVAATPCDTSNLVQVRALGDFAVERFGTIDVWVNSAAVSGPYGELETVPPERFEDVVRTNVLGCYHGTLVALEHMLPAAWKACERPKGGLPQRGKIINIAGLGADGRPAPYQVAYSSSKAWVLSFTRSVAAEHEGSGVGVFALNPGMMLTDLVTKVEATDDLACKRLESLPTVLRILAQPPEVAARHVLWLASSATDGKTGLIVRELTLLAMTRLGLAEVGRRLTGRTKAVPDVEVRRQA